MGARYDLSSVNVVSYLISRARVPVPRLTRRQLQAFFQRLVDSRQGHRPRLISTDPDWVAELMAHAERGLAAAKAIEARESQPVEPSTVTRLLQPLADAFGRYDVYVLPVGSSQHTHVLERFGEEAAYIPGHGILVLLPDYYDPYNNIQVLDPDPGTSAAVKNRANWPGAVYMLSDGESRYFPLEEAHSRLIELASYTATAGPAFDAIAREIITRPARVEPPPPRRILHLSDLHLGTDRAARTQTMLQTALLQTYRSLDTIVITGDLFDQPSASQMQHYRNFADQLQLICGTKPIIVPGNHDQRIFGNSIFGLGRRLRQLADLELRPIQPVHDQKLVFLCFDSSRTGNLARGAVKRDQLLRMHSSFEVENVKGGLVDYLKVALVHHHPYRYEPERDVPIVDPRSWPGREEFVAFRGAPDFLSWCAARGVGLVLHGHKHIPRLVHDKVPPWPREDTERREITTVGCGSSLGANGRDLSFNIIEWQPESQTWTVDFQIAGGDGRPFRSAAIGSHVELVDRR